MAKLNTNKPIRALAWAVAVLLAALFVTGCAGTSDRFGPGAGSFHTVVLDPGHGGHDPGARALSGSREKFLALDTSRRLAAILRKKGFRVVETRTTDVFIPLPRRVQISNANSGAIFVSIHYNWARRAGASGVETFYCSPRSKRLAANIQKEAVRAYPAGKRVIKPARFHVLRNNRRPAVLCELGFLSNKNDNRYVQNPTYRKRLAERIAAGIVAEKEGRIP